MGVGVGVDVNAQGTTAWCLYNINVRKAGRQTTDRQTYRQAYR